MIPILSPAGVQEILDFGLHGWAMSRFSGNWIAFKALKDTIESTASIDGSLDRVKIILPEGFVMPDYGLNIRASDKCCRPATDMKRAILCGRMQCIAYLHANKLDRIAMSGGNRARLRRHYSR